MRVDVHTYLMSGEDLPELPGWEHELGIVFTMECKPDSGGIQGDTWLEVECDDWKIVEVYASDYSNALFGCLREECDQIVSFCKLVFPELYLQWEAAAEKYAESEGAKCEAEQRYYVERDKGLDCVPF